MRRLMKILFIITLFPVYLSYGQEISNSGLDQEFLSKYKTAISSPSSVVSDAVILPKSKSGNSYDFLLISYVISGNNRMYEATKDLSYLKKNNTLIHNIQKSAKGTKSVGNIWIAKIKPNESNFAMNNKEFRLFESYLFRYIAEYYYLLSQIDKPLLSKNGLNPSPTFAENNFLKWYRQSTKSYGDDSMLQEIRTHMGALWATTALYLFKVSGNETNKKIYRNVFTRFNQALKKNMNLVDVGGGEKCYIWNSTWNEPFTKSLLKRSASYNNFEPQDVTHGNHVVQFIVVSNRLGLNNWIKTDLKYLANTVKYKIWNKSSQSFCDNVDGSTSTDKALVNTGWKQSDGWMELISIDPSLYNIYYGYYKKNSNFIDKTILSLQFYANFLKFNPKNIK